MPERLDPSPFLKSSPCTLDQLESADFQGWIDRLRPVIPAHGIVRPDGSVFTHRKTWEWAYITQALYERGLLAPGKKGLGFAVGREPLPALFASLGAEIVATDLAEDRAKQQGWVATDQHAASLAGLNPGNLCPPEEFAQRVSFRTLNMNAISRDLDGQFDFVWSSCSMEHLGSLVHGKRFVLNAMRLLRPGGVAVHTTEFNVCSNGRTLKTGGTVLFRRRDVEEIARALGRLGHRIELEFTFGDRPEDNFIDVPPYTHDPHLKLRVAEYVATATGMIVEKGDLPERPDFLPLALGAAGAAALALWVLKRQR